MIGCDNFRSVIEPPYIQNTAIDKNSESKNDMITKKSHGFTTIEALFVIGLAILVVGGFILPQRWEKNRMEKRAQTQRVAQERVAEYFGPPQRILTIANNSYFRLQLAGPPDANAVTILKAVAEFERKNPDKEVVGWSVDGIHETYYSDGKVYGLWINHRPKVLSLEK